jgi:adenylate kinase family enzyme/inosine/xanthosine triphosphate pyrophosphatase family protein
MTEIVFFTSSAIKLAHARYLCRDYDVQITGFREKTFGANYEEPRIYDRAELIERSYQDALQRWKKSVSSDEQKLFFIEDTSVIIEALSVEREVPGLDVKYWMAETDFASLDAQLRELGNNRHCKVRSDLVLHLPKDLRKDNQGGSYRCFTSYSHGSIVDQEHVIATNLMYPWLDNKTFNKWFVPLGYEEPISLLPITKADKHDFRAAAFREMLSFLEHHGQIAKRGTPIIQTQLEAGVPLFVICGPSCAGKTTLAEHLAESYGYYHIEASDFMYLSYYQRHGVGSSVPIGDFAEQALREQPEIVARQVLDNIQTNQPIAAVITGFRSPLELAWFKNYYGGHQPIVPVFIDADASIRYERSLDRGREAIPDNWERFQRRDAQQAAMGLSDLALSLASDHIKNEGGRDTFFENFADRYLGDWPFPQNISYNTLSAGVLEKLILKTLYEQGEDRDFFTTTEIAHLINRNLPADHQRSKNNISRYFNQRFYPYYEIKLIDGKRKYRLSNTGQGKVKLLDI